MATPSATLRWRSVSPRGWARTNPHSGFSLLREAASLRAGFNDWKRREHIAEFNRRAAETELRLKRLYDSIESSVKGGSGGGSFRPNPRFLHSSLAGPTQSSDERHDLAGGTSFIRHRLNGRAGLFLHETGSRPSSMILQVPSSPWKRTARRTSSAVSRKQGAGSFPTRPRLLWFATRCSWSAMEGWADAEGRQSIEFHPDCTTGFGMHEQVSTGYERISLESAGCKTSGEAWGESVDREPT